MKVKNKRIKKLNKNQSKTKVLITVEKNQILMII